MSRRSQAILVLSLAATLLALGCAKPSIEPPRCEEPQPPAWTLLGEPPLDSNGTSAPLSITPPSDAQIVSLRVSDPTGNPVCVQLESVSDPAAGSWVTTGPGDFGPYCLGCPQRVSVGIGYGLFVLPSNSQPPPRASVLNVVASARDCTTLLRAGASRPERLRIEALFRPASPAQRTGTLPLELAFRHDSPLAAAELRDAVLPEVLERVNAELAAGGLRVSVRRSRTVDFSDELSLTRGDNTPLDALHGQLLDSNTDCSPATIPVVFAGCIRVSDSLTGFTSEPDGLTPGIPSGFPAPGRGDGIYLKGQSCHSGAPIPWSPSLLAKLLAHELGHYLGLYHSVEPDGAVDQLDDTDERNLMFHNPLESSAQSFSRSQLEVMRRHPAIRWDEL